MKLTHLGISHFRSIGETPVMIDLSKKITVLVGQNDCGKSNVLRGMELAWHHSTNSLRKLSSVDHHQRSGDISPCVHLFSKPARWLVDGVRVEDASNISEAEVWKDDLLQTLTLISPVLKQHQDPRLEELDSTPEDVLDALYEQIKGMGFSRANPEERVESMKREIAKHFDRQLSEEIPFVRLVPQFRKIDDTGDYTLSGTGVTKLLATWQVPEIGQEGLRAKFDTVQNLVRTLLERPEVQLQIPASRREIIVEEPHLRLPLESHGTGIHQLIILAIAALSEDNALFGIEEPEIHLHPVLQRRFFKFLREETGNNRYIITTHSQTMIAPAEDVDVIHLKMVEGVTIPTRITTDAQALEALEDLGIRASDLLQANAVIWVEGPSDRIYLKRWMELVNAELDGPELIEGIDYAIMFYGGRLLSHLSLERDDETDDGFVQLLRINQRSAILMDSDRKKSLSDPLNATKQRVISECETNGLHAWVTEGREIENYLTPRTVEAAVSEAGLTPDDRFELKATGKFDDSFGRVVGAKAQAWCKYEDNKVPWAHRLVKHIELQDMTPELQKQVTALIAYIRRRPPATPREKTVHP